METIEADSDGDTADIVGGSNVAVNDVAESSSAALWSGAVDGVQAQVSTIKQSAAARR
jgi:hypothetical protein